MKIRSGIKKMMAAVLAASLCMGMNVINVYAESNVTSASVSVKSTFGYEEVLEPEISVSGRVTLEDMEWSKDIEDWKPAQKVTGTVYLRANDGYTFKASYSKSEVRISGGTFASARRDSDDSSLLVVKFSYYPRVQLGTTEQAGWSSRGDRQAVWKKVPYATAYELKLYRDGAHFKSMDVTGTSVDLSEFLKEETAFYYEVRAVAKAKSESSYIRSGEYVASEDIVLENLGDTTGYWRDYQEGSRYHDASGNYLTGWQLINGKRYYFNQDGYTINGWNWIDNAWYYMDANHELATGWLILDNVKYYLNPDGVMLSGWIKAGPAATYYAAETGVIMTGWQEIDGAYYYFGSDGLMAVNTVIDGQYTVDENGVWLQ